MCEPYSTVIDIDYEKLPNPEEVKNWNSEQFADTLRHDQSCEMYNPDYRQLLHVSYKIASQMGHKFTEAVKKYEFNISPNVIDNIFKRHIKPVFGI